MNPKLSHLSLALAAACIVAIADAQAPAASPAAARPAVPATAQPAVPAGVATVPGMPPVIDASNLYSETTPTHLSAAVRNALARVYVPHIQSNDVYVIDPATLKVVDRFRVGVNPQHVVPSWDMTTLWVANNAEGRMSAMLARNAELICVNRETS